MVIRKYSIDGQKGKEPLLKCAAGLFGNNQESLKTLRGLPQIRQKVWGKRHNFCRRLGAVG